MVQQRLNGPDNPSFRSGLPSQHDSMPAASASRSKQARPDRSMSGWQQGKRCRCRNRCICRNSRVWPTVSWPNSQTMARVGASEWALRQPGTGRHRSHEGQSKPTIPHRIRHRQTHSLSPTHPPTATLLYGLTGQSSSAAAPPFSGPPSRRRRADIVEIPRAQFPPPHDTAPQTCSSAGLTD